jgi:S-adenosylmethionine:tRNA-ribosyltransferase-isomerase (queuine synthetase)
MTFMEAVQAMRHGDKTGREERYKKVYVIYNGSICELLDGLHFDHDLDLEDFEADDWEVK